MENDPRVDAGCLRFEAQAQRRAKISWVARSRVWAT